MTNKSALHVLAVETDTKLSALYQEEQKIVQKLGWNADSIRHAAGQKKSHYRGGSDWSGSLKDALSFRPANDWTKGQFDKLVAERLELSDALKANQAEQKNLNGVWAANGRWSRFFLVTNSNGHIHSSLDCSTTYETTQFAWLPQLSGLTEAEAVADQGEILCSICFPSAPVAWTDGISKASRDGKAQRAAEKLERDAKKNAKLLFADGSSLKARRGWTEEQANSWSEKITTLAAAKAWLTDGFDPHRGGYVKWDLGLVAEAYAARTGETVEAVLAAAKLRASKRKN